MTAGIEGSSDLGPDAAAAFEPPMENGFIDDDSAAEARPGAEMVKESSGMRDAPGGVSSGGFANEGACGSMAGLPVPGWTACR